MPHRYDARIIRHIADPRYERLRVRQLARALNIADEEQEAFRRAIDEMVADGRVVLDGAATIGLPPPGSQMIGTFRLSRRGFGFVVPESATEHGDLFVPAGQTAGALTGDLVRAKVIRAERRAGGGRSPFIGRIDEILQRADRHYVGDLVQRGARWLVEVDGHHLHDPVLIRDPHAKDASVGDKVVIELLTYPSETGPGEGVITEVLGRSGEPDVETEAVMRTYGLAGPFPDDVLAEARAAVQAFEDVAAEDREDLTDQLTCTIDPPDARDFDDAISVEPLAMADGAEGFRLGVHIADVTAFVKPGGALDVEARARGNSAYLPRRVVPMLPEVLSNGVCSLQENVARLCQSAFIDYDAEGQVVGCRFARTTIRSAKRLTYLEAQALIDDDVRAARRHCKAEARYPRPLIAMLKRMDDLARRIRQRRHARGMVVLDLPEVELVFDESGRVADAVPEDDAFTHTIIEMFMVEANEQVARLFDGLGVPMIRRVHADPPGHDLTALRQFARVAGYNIPARPSRDELQALLEAVRGTPAQHAVHLAVLQTLSRAEYAPLVIGHFALASDHYTHFTSPIRRYPDLVVHRALQAYIEHAGDGRGGRQRQRLAAALRGDPRCPDEPALADLGRYCSQTERNAEAAEHDLTNYLVLELLSEQVGEDFSGTVTGVSGSGLFVQLDRFLVDGFIRISELPAVSAGHDERWRLNRTTGAMVAQRSGRTISIGDRFTVRIALVNPAARQLDLVIIQDGRPEAKKRRQPAGARKAHQKTMQLKRQKRKPGRR